MDTIFYHDTTATATASLKSKQKSKWNDGDYNAIPVGKDASRSKYALNPGHSISRFDKPFDGFDGGRSVGLCGESGSDSSSCDSFCSVSLCSRYNVSTGLRSLSTRPDSRIVVATGFKRSKIFEVAGNSLTNLTDVSICPPFDKGVLSSNAESILYFGHSAGCSLFDISSCSFRSCSRIVGANDEWVDVKWKEENHSIVAFLSKSGALHLVDSRNFKPIWSAPINGVSAATFCKTGNDLLLGSESGGLSKVDIRTMECMGSIGTHYGAVKSLCCVGHKNYMSGHSLGHLAIWSQDELGFKEDLVMDNFSTLISEISHHPDLQVVVACSESSFKAAKLYSLASSRWLHLSERVIVPSHVKYASFISNNLVLSSNRDIYLYKIN